MSAISSAISELERVCPDPIDTDKIESIIRKHSITAAAAGLASGVLPGVGAVIGTLTNVGAIWSMYYRICNELHINVSQNFLKSVGSALLSNLITQLGGVLAVELVGSLIPGLSIIITGAACYAVTHVSGLIFINLLTKMYLAGKKPDEMSEQEFTDFGKSAAASTDCRTAFKNAMADAKRQIKNGSITKNS